MGDIFQVKLNRINNFLKIVLIFRSSIFYILSYKERELNSLRTWIAPININCTSEDSIIILIWKIYKHLLTLIN